MLYSSKSNTKKYIYIDNGNFIWKSYTNTHLYNIYLKIVAFLYITQHKLTINIKVWLCVALKYSGCVFLCEISKVKWSIDIIISFII